METMTPGANRLSAFVATLVLVAGLAVSLAMSLTVSGASADAPKNPRVVVELFTSQGCYSCPPADAYLRELAKRDDVLALSMHVDYWNGLGWPDPFSNAEVTARQRRYVRTLGTSYVYTPQMVVAGRSQAVGSERATVARLIAEARAEADDGPKVVLAPAGRDRLRAAIGAAPFKGTATVWLVAFDSGHTTQIGAGENGGKTLSYANVVRDIRAVGTWSGAAMELSLDVTQHVAKGYGNWALLIQTGAFGRIVAATALPGAALGH